MSMTKDIHGHVVHADDSTEKGTYYLQYDLDAEQAEVFFKQAKLHGAADFEDHHNRQFTLTYDRGAGSYQLTART